MVRFLLRWTVRLLAAIGFVAVLMVAGGLGAAYWFSGLVRSDATMPDQVVLVADWRGGVPEKPSGFRSIAALGIGARPSLPEVLVALDRAKRDPRVAGVVARVDGTGFSATAAEELHTAIAALRDAGKLTAVYADSLGELDGGLVGTYLAAAFEHVQVQPVGSVAIVGLQSEQVFVRRLLDDYDVDFQVVQREAFKSALESVSRTAPSPESAATTRRLLEGLFDELVTGIARGRGLAVSEVEAAVAAGPLSAEAARERGLIDEVAHAARLRELVEDRVGEVGNFDLDRYVDVPLADTPAAEATIGFVHAVGPIFRGKSDDPFGDRQIAGDSVAAAIDAARRDDVDAVLLRVNSPGGSAVASETIAAAVRQARSAGIPVVVSMADVAASGGYWISMDASRIMASAMTLTGSIGVIAGKPALAGLLERLGVDVTIVRQGGSGTLTSLVEPWTAADLARVDAFVDVAYGQFLERVAAGRDLPVDTVRGLAGGRVWLGREAHANGLVDDLGGFVDAVAAATEAVGAPTGATVELVHYPDAPAPYLRFLRELGLVSHGLAEVRGLLRAAMAGTALRAEAPAWYVR